MVYRFNRDPIIDDGRTLRVDRMRVNSFSKRGIGSNTTQGFRTGGAPPPGSTPDAAHNTIEKFPFSSDANATDVGDLTVARNGSNIASSASDLVFDKNFAEITMTYIDATIGWSV